MSKYQEIVNACKYLLHNCPEAESYLQYINSRVSLKMQEKFEFGYFPKTKNINLLLDLVEEDTLKKYNLIFDKKIYNSAFIDTIKVSYFEDHSLIFPCKDVYGNIVGLIGRTLLNDQLRAEIKIDKYKYTMGFRKGNHLFGLNETKKSILENDLVYIVEGQLDVIKAFEKGFTNVVAIGGSSMTPQQLSIICRYTNNLLLALDNDDAGKTGRERIFSKFSNFANIDNVYIPQGYKDIDEFLSQNDMDSLNFVVKNVKYSL